MRPGILYVLRNVFAIMAGAGLRPGRGWAVLEVGLLMSGLASRGSGSAG
jgi:hypothetical protein